MQDNNAMLNQPGVNVRRTTLARGIIGSYLIMTVISMEKILGSTKGKFIRNCYAYRQL